MHVAACVWLRREARAWSKTNPISATVEVVVPDEHYTMLTSGDGVLSEALQRVAGPPGLSAEVRVEVEPTSDGGTELCVLLVNTSPKTHASFKDTNLYETSLSLGGIETAPFLLEALPDSFRYDRRVPAYGVNCGVVVNDNTFETTDTITINRYRPRYFDACGQDLDISFRTLSEDPIPPLTQLVDRLDDWGNRAWDETTLAKRAKADLWSTTMRQEARSAAEAFEAELSRIREGVNLLTEDTRLCTAFRLMNEAMGLAVDGKYPGWRPFQIGFVLANIKSVVAPHEESKCADIVWFATGGGKTETYLGLLLVAALHDRITGKSHGMTAWSRFPLRMLSLQQTQRFADALGAAELVRRKHRIDGAPFSLGFFVGQGATPNRIPVDAKQHEPDPDDDDMPHRYRILMECPFCRRDSIEMAFNRRLWTLQHQCRNKQCPWPEEGLPFYIVDDEIYRFLPTVVVGTLDKAALISSQASMTGFFGPPQGKCSVTGHGFTYATRSKKPNGCLVPGCPGSVEPLPMEAARFGPSFRLQDELHLLRDSLGAVDAHYESLLDHLQTERTGHKPKILASSATLAGFEKQVDVLYKRAARVFPTPGPRANDGFWSTDSELLLRRFVGVAPRGVTQEFAVDRMLTELQRSIRRLVSDPVSVCKEIGVDEEAAPHLVSLYGVDVVYGNTLRDLDASVRSLETQVPVDGRLNTATLTGRTDFEEVRRSLDRLKKPESDYQERLHVVAASSMMSHGVDIDRLNVLVMLGLPLTAAEFIQTSARVGRTWPGLVFVLHKIARERDASVYRSFEKFVEQGDRFVEPIPVTRRSRRVLERTLAGVALARILAVHEPRSSKALTLVSKLRDYCSNNGVTEAQEVAAVVEALHLTDNLDEPLREDVKRWYERFFHNLDDPGGEFRFPSDLCPLGPPMRSLRDVEEQAPVYGVLRT